MENIELRKMDGDFSTFVIIREGEQIGEMVVSVKGNILTVHHTGVKPGARGRGLGKELLNAMVAYAREQKLHVKALCAFVLAEFRRHPEEYADLRES